ncbi:MAG: flavin monoamine oxidase family protein, partial [Solirubrobacteraceae bacterium]
TEVGAPLDLGGQWIGPAQERIAALAREFGLATFKTYDSGLNVQYRDGARTTYSGAVPTGDPLASADVIEAMLTLNMMASAVPLEAPWRAPEAALWDSQTLATWLDANVQSEGARHLLTLGVEAVFSAEPRDLSLLHALFYYRSGNGVINLTSTAGGAQDSRFDGGSQLVSIRMAERLGERVVLNAPVRRIAHAGRGVTVTTDAGTWHGKAVIVAMAPALAGRIDYDPPLPAQRDQLTQRVPQGSVIKYEAVYPKPFWRAEGLSAYSNSDRSPIRLTYDNSPPSGTPGVLLGFATGRDARRLSTQGTAARRKAVLRSFTRLFGPKAAHPRMLIEHNWSEEPWTRGCYEGYLPPGVWTDFGAALRAPIGRIHWAGTETSEVFMGYMDGAVRSGERAASEVRSAL